MKISVITIAYNAAETIEDTIKSVLLQTFKNIQYIIVDGASSDNTLQIVQKYKTQLHHIISEPDKGVYDAMNKGLAHATGDIIAILNADDTYAHEEVLALVHQTFEQSGADTCYGNIIYVNRNPPHKTTRTWIAGNYSKKAFLNGWMPPHPAFFAKRELYQKFGNFNLKLKTSADYELMLRFLYKHHATTAYINNILVKMKVGGQSNASLKNRLRANKEDRMAWKINGLKPGKFTLAKKPLLKIFQFLKR